MADDETPTPPPTPTGPPDFTKLLTPEDMEAARAYVGKIKHEFTVTYGLTWTEERLTFSGAMHATATFEDYRAEAVDHGPLSYWRVEQQTPGGAYKILEGTDENSYLIAKFKAMDALVRHLDARAAGAAEALKDPEPVGVTGPQGSTGMRGPVGVWGAAAPAPAAPLAPAVAGPHNMATGVRGVTGPAPASAPVPAGIGPDDDADD